MTDRIAPDATWQQWMDDPTAAAEAVLNHAATAGTWDAVPWVAAIGGGLLAAVKVARLIPGPWQGVAAMAESWLPRLTGRRERAIRQQADRTMDVAREGVRFADEAIEHLRQLDPDRANGIIARAKDAQDRIGIRDEVRAVLRELRRDERGE